MKLFWKEVRDDCMPSLSTSKTIWDEMPEASVDVEKLEHLFESRAKDLISKVSQRVFSQSFQISTTQFIAVVFVSCRDQYLTSVLCSYTHKRIHPYL